MPSEASLENRDREGSRRLTTRHKLLTNSWAQDVEMLEEAIGRFTEDRRLANDCQVVFFELAGDAELHVNVTHRYLTKSVSGWAGPATVPDGFVHNRTFSDMQPRRMLRHIREMVFAA